VARLSLPDPGTLIVEFGGERRVLSSAVLGGGMGVARCWLNVTVPADYARTDPDVDLAERAVLLGLEAPVVGMLTAARVEAYVRHRHGLAQTFATVGVGHALAAAGLRRAVASTGHEPGAAASRAGTINLLVLVDAPFDDAALAGAAQTAVEAKAQALAAARVPAANAGGFATGTATDAFCIACPPGGGVRFAGPATRAGADVARAVFEAVKAGALADRAGADGAEARTVAAVLAPIGRHPARTRHDGSGEGLVSAAIGRHPARTRHDGSGEWPG
jgi:adenosylcobinamide amidohydrolase